MSKCVSFEHSAGVWCFFFFSKYEVGEGKERDVYARKRQRCLMTEKSSLRFVDSSTCTSANCVWYTWGLRELAQRRPSHNYKLFDSQLRFYLPRSLSLNCSESSINHVPDPTILTAQDEMTRYEYKHEKRGIMKRWERESKKKKLRETFVMNQKNWLLFIYLTLWTNSIWRRVNDSLTHAQWSMAEANDRLPYQGSLVIGYHTVT